MNKRIIRVIIYEGDEELVDAYEQNSLNRTQKSYGHPRWFNVPQITTGKQIFITGVTLDAEIGIFQAIDKHNQEVLKQNNIPRQQIPLQDLVTNLINNNK